MRAIRHKKTGKIYYLLNDEVICATNEHSGQRNVLYVGKERTTNEWTFFVREFNEFFERFEFTTDIQTTLVGDIDNLNQAVHFVTESIFKNEDK